MSKKLPKSKKMATVRVTIRDLEHYKSIATYLDKRFGVTRKDWKINIPIKRKLIRGSKNITKNILVKKEAENEIEELAIFLTLL